MNKLPLLEENQTKVFFSPVEGNDTLVRTGVLSYITPLIHCLLHATSKDYVEMDNDGRKSMASTIYSHISDKITEENWKQSKTDSTSKELFVKNVVLSLKNFREKNKKEELYDLLFQLVSISFIENILEKNKNSEIEDNIIAVNKEVKNQLETVLKKLEEKKRRIYIEKFLELLRKIFDNAEESCAAEKKVPSTFLLNQKNVRILSDKFHRNIYFLDATTRLPYKVNSIEEMPERKSIVVLKLNEKYEVVGKLLSGNKIQREFQSTDEVIKKIHTFIYFPEEIPKKYPFLSVHLPKAEKPAVNTKVATVVTKVAEKRENRDRVSKSAKPEPVKPIEKQELSKPTVVPADNSVKKDPIPNPSQKPTPKTEVKVPENSRARFDRIRKAPVAKSPSNSSASSSESDDSD